MNLFRFIIFLFQIYLSCSIMKLQGQMEQTVINAVSFIWATEKVDIPKVDIKAKPKVSIVIPVYNEAKYLKDVIKSIQFQSLKEIEILIIDDKSTDNSVKIIKF